MHLETCVYCLLVLGKQHECNVRSFSESHETPKIASKQNEKDHQRKQPTNRPNKQTTKPTNKPTNQNLYSKTVRPHQPPPHQPPAELHSDPYKHCQSCHHFPNPPNATNRPRKWIHKGLRVWNMVKGACLVLVTLLLV